MYWLTSHIIPSLQIMKILGDTDTFLLWMRKTHPHKNPEELFDGYKFSLECCLNSFVDGICGDQILGIESDFLLDRALAELVPLHHISNTCEKTIFLKNLKPHVKAVLKTLTYNGLKQKYEDFEKNISSRFYEIQKNHLVLSKDIELDIKTANQFWLIDYVYIYLVQINNNGPTANSRHPFNTSWTPRERMEKYLEGYKYAIQFLWHQLLGFDEYNKTHLKRLHLADSWRDYKYIKVKKSNNPLMDIFNRKFRLEEQSSFDSYFYWIQNEIINPLSDKHGITLHVINDYFQFKQRGYNKQKLFGDLLNVNKIQQNHPELGWDNQIKKSLYWYPFEVVNARESQMHLGIPSFNTMLAGTVTLHDSKASELSKVIVSKFTHPYSNDKNKNDYSYGIMVDAYSAAGHYSSGWVIYQNACGDYSGFSGSEHKSSEKLILKYLKLDKIELRELTIPLKKFIEFTDQYVKDEKELSILEENKLIPDLIQKSRSQLLEYFTYYVCSKTSIYNDYNIKLSVDKNSKEGEKDVIIINENEVILIECKLNPQNYNVEKLIKKMWDKVNTYSHSRKSCQLWCWEELSSKNKKLLDLSVNSKTPVTYVEVNNPTKHPILHRINLKQLKFIMQDYTKNDQFDYNDIDIEYF